MIRHHPSDATLIAQAAGTCRRCTRVCWRCTSRRARAAATNCVGMEEVGGALLATLPPAPLRPDALARTLARLDEPARAERADRPAAPATPGGARALAAGGGSARASG